MDIWHINSKDLPSILLWRRTDGKFHVVKDGNYSPLLGNGNYILIAKKYLKILDDLVDQVVLKEAVVIDTQFKTESTDYLEMEIINTIDTESIHSMDSSGMKIWCYDGYVFVSGALKKKIIDMSKEDFCFSRGFEQFG